jgi:hypothetical protein
MIDHNRITAAKVAHKLSEDKDIVRPDSTEFQNYCKSITGKPNFDIKRRNYEIENTDDYGKLFFATHHLRKIKDRLEQYLSDANLDKPKIVLGGNSMNDTKFMSSISDDIDNRVLPAIKALSHFTQPADVLLDEYESIVNNYNETVQSIKSSIPKGPGHYKKVCEKILPEYIDFLNSNINFIEDVLNRYDLEHT